MDVEVSLIDEEWMIEYELNEDFIMAFFDVFEAPFVNPHPDN